MLKRAQIPNLLTFARVLAVPAALAVILLDPVCKPWALFAIFAAASVTDFLDGYLARKWSVVSAIGALMDPIADKLLVALMLVYLLMRAAVIADSSALIVFVPVIIILLRELYISGLREFLASRSITLPVSKGGKWKTATQMLAIALLLLSDAMSALDGQHVGMAGMGLLYVSALLALTSAIGYTKASWKHLR